MKPIISVIVPVFNAAQYLSEAIESVLIQTFSDFELILIDDGSKDRSWEIICEFASRDSRIRTFQNEFNRGIYFTRNLGLEMSTGKYIAVMDSDDISLPDRFVKQITYLESHPEIDVLGGQIVKFGDVAQSTMKSNYPLTPGGIQWGMLSGCQLAHSTVMMRNHLFSSEGFRYRDFKVAQDYELWTRLAPGHKIANLPDVLVKYRIHQSSISQTKESLQKDETIGIIKSYITEVSGENLPEAIIRGLIVTKEIRSVDDALFLSKFLVKLEKLTDSWGLNLQEKSEISHQTAYKLHSICKHFHYNPRLFRVLLTSGFLESQALWLGKFKDN